MEILEILGCNKRGSKGQSRKARSENRIKSWIDFADFGEPETMHACQCQPSGGQVSRGKLPHVKCRGILMDVTTIKR